MAKERQGERARERGRGRGEEREREERMEERTEGRRGEEECMSLLVNKEMQTKQYFHLQNWQKKNKLCEVGEDAEVSALR